MKPHSAPDSFRIQKSTPPPCSHGSGWSQFPGSVPGVPPSAHPNVFGDHCPSRPPCYSLFHGAIPDRVSRKHLTDVCGQGDLGLDQCWRVSWQGCLPGDTVTLSNAMRHSHHLLRDERQLPF